MKVEVQFVGNSVEVLADIYVGEYVTWILDEGQFHVYVGKSKDDPPKVASYPEDRIVRIRVI